MQIIRVAFAAAAFMRMYEQRSQVSSSQHRSAVGKSARTTTSTASTSREFSIQQSMRESTIGVLQIYKKQCKRDGDFRGARETNTRIGRLKQEHAIAKREGMILRHAEELHNLQRTIRSQIYAYFTEWETRKLSSLKMAVDEIRKALSRRQQREREDFIEGLENGRVKYRVTLPPLTLDLMAKARYMVLQDRHEEAKQLMLEAEERELERKLKEHARQQGKLARIRNEFDARQLRERRMTEDKIRRMKEEVLKHQRLELEELRSRAQQQLDAPLLVVSFGQKYSGPNSNKYKIEGKYDIPVNYKAIVKWGEDEIVVLTRQGPFGPEFQLIYLPKSSVADDFTLFEWNSNMTQLWDELLTVLETMDEGGTRDMSVFNQGPWYIFGFTEDAVQTELGKVVKKDETDDLVDGILYCQEGDKPTLEEYQRYLGVQPELDDHFIWISHEFMSEPLPANYYQYTNAGMVYWVDASTQESTWKHPHYDKYKKMLSVAREQRPLPHWKTIMNFQIELLFSELFKMDDPNKTDFDVPIETVNNVFELARIFKVNIKEEPYLTHVLKRALRHYAGIVKSKRAVGDVEEFRNLMQRYRDIVQQFERAYELESEQVASLRQCVECPEDNKEPAELRSFTVTTAKICFASHALTGFIPKDGDNIINGLGSSSASAQSAKRRWLSSIAFNAKTLSVTRVSSRTDSFGSRCFAELRPLSQVHVRGGRRNHVPIVLRSFSPSVHKVPASSTFAFGAISPAAVTIGANAASNLAISMSPWLVFEDECEINVYYNLLTGECQRDLPLAPINTSIESGIGGGFSYGWAESLTCT
ncbi:hypothetical protein FOL47_010131 [Perkinsus chesapeaki]|uniref:WW domain-containing protein n=1 Tax=Perkinsus chesapeaki TaxID=330153 RepID=A0A7J6MS11_PERCH|nr:hypothetical protein FOL47_010131 [Perkinsus chesapeaki]